MRVELALVDDVLREALAPQRHGFLVHLGDAEIVLPPPVVVTILVGDKLRRGASSYARSRVGMLGKFNVL